MRTLLTVSVSGNLDREWMIVNVSDEDRELNGDALKEGVLRALETGETIIDPWPGD